MVWSLASEGKRGPKPKTKEEEKAARKAAKDKRQVEKNAAAKKAVNAPMRSIEELRALLAQKASVGQLVSMMDDNNNDKINFDEFKQGIFMCGMRPVPTDKEITALFRSFDANRDGTLSYQEVFSLPLYLYLATVLCSSIH